MSYSPVNTSEIQPTIVDLENPSNGIELPTIANDQQQHDRSRTSSQSSSQGALAGRYRASTFAPNVPDNSPTVLTFTNITVATRTKPKKILLNDISGSITGKFHIES